ncbi:hypothetical protein ACFL0P_00665 [Candidatus Omnitrophota bacterium]
MKKMIFLIILLIFIYGCATTPNQAGQNYINLHPEISEKIKQGILAKRIDIGMTSQELIASWAYPRRIGRTVTDYGTREQWIYDPLGDYRTYVYLENDIVTDWQD